MFLEYMKTQWQSGKVKIALQPSSHNSTPKIFATGFGKLAALLLSKNELDEMLKFAREDAQNTAHSARKKIIHDFLSWGESRGIQIGTWEPIQPGSEFSQFSPQAQEAEQLVDEYLLDVCRDAGFKEILPMDAFDSTDLEEVSRRSTLSAFLFFGFALFAALALAYVISLKP